MRQPGRGKAGGVQPFFSAALAVTLGFGASAAMAGPVSQELQQVLKGKAASETVPVIVTFADRVNPAQFVGKGRKGRSAELIRAVRAKANAVQGPFRSFIQGRGGRQIKELWATNSLAAEVPASLVGELETMPGVESIRLDGVVQAPVVTYGATGTPEWNIAAIRAPDLWALGYMGTGVVVANMDTGVDNVHPDLSTRWRGGSNSWYDPNSQHATPFDAQGHGTQTMGLMVGGNVGGTAIGVAPDARWIAVKIFNDVGQASYSNIHLGFQWLLDPDGNPATADAPDVVNNSWGLQGVDQCVLEFNNDIQVLKAAGVAVTFSAGNDGLASLTSGSPANNPNAYAAGAVDSGLNIAGFSSRGSSACDGTAFPKIVAPGVDVRTADLSFGGMPNYATVSGTSYSAPQVAGVMALIAQAFPAASVAAIEGAVGQSAQDLGLIGPDNSYGYGLVNALATHDVLAAGTTVNYAPVAGNDGFGVQAGIALTVAVPGVLANDSDPDGNPLTAVLVNGSTGGTLALNANGSFSYTPNPGTTADSFTYQASDGLLASNTATVSITVAANKPPVAGNDNTATSRNTAVNINVLANDSDPDGSLASASVTVVAKPAKGGTAMPNADGTVRYTPKTNFTGTESFSYTVKDNLGAVSNTATVSVSVTRR